MFEHKSDHIHNRRNTGSYDCRRSSVGNYLSTLNRIC
jgi:hypothetical protein